LAAGVVGGVSGGVAWFLLVGIGLIALAIID
jgi:hypothetical protein